MTVSYAQIQASTSISFENGCPSRVLLDHVMGKWGVLVLLQLSEGTQRWSELRRGVDGISEKMLASTLKPLVADGIVERISHPTVPPHVDYRLTPAGEELMQRMLPLVEWVAHRAGQAVVAGTIL